MNLKPVIFSHMRKILVASIMLSFFGCASTPTASKKLSQDRLELGVGYTAYRGANIYGTYKGFTDKSVIDVNTQLALSDKSLNGKQLFAVPEIDNRLSLGYAASFRDFKIIPTDSTTKNMTIAINAISAFVPSEREQIITTVGAERITSKTGMAGDTGYQLLFPVTTTYRLDNRVHPQIPTEGFGYFLKGTAEGAPFGINYLKGSLRGQLDIPIFNEFSEKLALSFKGFIGAGSGIGSDSLPITKRLFLENGSPVRGYAANAFGYNARNIPIGGNLMATASAEMWMPFFHEDLRAFAFFDTGLMKGNGIDSVQSNLKKSVGAGVAWASPIGIVSISYGQALDNSGHKQALGINLGFNY
jgi:outer membrane protein assembly factor BamA